MSPIYQYNVGDIIETYDKSFGIIIGRKSAYDHMAFSLSMADDSIKTYMNIAVYKALVDGSITYLNESNIAGVIEWKTKKI